MVVFILNNNHFYIKCPDITPTIKFQICKMRYQNFILISHFTPPAFFVKQIDALRINFSTKKGYRLLLLRKIRRFLLKNDDI